MSYYVKFDISRADALLVTKIVDRAYPTRLRTAQARLDLDMISHGVWFTRKAAEEYLADRAYNFPKEAFVFCGSGYESTDLADAYAASGNP